MTDPLKLDEPVAAMRGVSSDTAFGAPVPLRHLSSNDAFVG